MPLFDPSTINEISFLFQVTRGLISMAWLFVERLQNHLCHMKRQATTVLLVQRFACRRNIV
ncbi:hypothetical protein POX_e06463 [Penicillium oxalicum]|uniref:Uncharacterized protein n=1 Tax=Penicillium oxalicum (strain 114-2 / CGMCC 5302) TaxID=933388 RepID=S8ANM9_PENO1|nr:hypothetical protein POX_e06463 [Penicillium oxalicum]EPS27498.1 hypothetical protein PDE_02441 [Penicillium oxalicum 114-2]KAI2788447.1 hypothetical protein POX_e06463 [Penicillium oxalicum]